MGTAKCQFFLFSIHEQNISDIFAVDEYSGTIQLKRPLKLSDGISIMFHVEANDGKYLTLCKIKIQQISNNHPPLFTTDNFYANIKENALIGNNWFFVRFHKRNIYESYYVFVLHFELFLYCITKVTKTNKEILFNYLGEVVKEIKAIDLDDEANGEIR